MPQQHEEDDGNGDNQSTENLRGGVFIVIILAANLHLHAFRQLETLQTLDDIIRDEAHILATGHLGHHRHGAQTVAVAYLAVLPRRHNLSKLAQGHAGLRLTARSDAEEAAGSGGDDGRESNGNQLVHDILLRSLVGIVGLHLHLNVVVTLPGGAHRIPVAIAEGHLQLNGLIGNTQTRGFLVVDLDASGRERLEHVAAHELQFRHLAHNAYQTITVLC